MVPSMEVAQEVLPERIILGGVALPAFLKELQINSTNNNNVCRHIKYDPWLLLSNNISSIETKSFFSGLLVRFSLLTLCPSLCQGPAGPSPPLLFPFLLDAGIQLGDCSNPQYGVLDPLENPEWERIMCLFLTCKSDLCPGALKCLNKFLLDTSIRL